MILRPGTLHDSQNVKYFSMESLFICFNDISKRSNEKAELKQYVSNFGGGGDSPV